MRKTSDNVLKKGFAMNREVLALCNLNNGVAQGGLSAANLNNTLSNAGWNIAGRISVKGRSVQTASGKFAFADTRQPSKRGKVLA